MEFLTQVLPIIIDLLLIVVIVVGIILGIKLIITVDKVLKVVDDVNEKIEKVSPLFDAAGIISDKFSGVVSHVVTFVESLIVKLFKKKEKDELESEIDE